METELRGELREGLFSTLRYCLEEKKKGEGEENEPKNEIQKECGERCMSE